MLKKVFPSDYPNLILCYSYLAINYCLWVCETVWLTLSSADLCNTLFIADRFLWHLVKSSKKWKPYCCGRNPVFSITWNKFNGGMQGSSQTVLLNYSIAVSWTGELRKCKVSCSHVVLRLKWRTTARGGKKTQNNPKQLSGAQPRVENNFCLSLISKNKVLPLFLFLFATPSISLAVFIAIHGHRQV